MQAEIEERIQVAQKYVPGVIASLGQAISGALAMIHDAKDFGRFDRIHHWLLGLVAFISGLVLLFFNLYFLVGELHGSIRE